MLVEEKEVGRITPGPSFADHSVQLQKADLRAGRNAVTLRYSWARSPKSLGHGPDRRRLAIAVDRIEVKGTVAASSPRLDPKSGSLTLPAASSIQWALWSSPGSRLEIDTIAAEVEDATIVASVQLSNGQGQEIGRWSSGGNYTAEFPATVGGPVLLTLRHVPGGHPGGDAILRGLRVRSPAGGFGREEERQTNTGLVLEPPTAAPLNVVIYLVDALRADHLGVYGYDRPTSPRVDSFAEQALVFEQAWANSSWTRPAVASILTGLRPEVHQTNRRIDSLPEGVPTLPEILRENGYQTAAVVANPNVSSTFGFDRGFDKFTLLAHGHNRSLHLHHEVSRWLSEDREDTRPFFLYLHTVDPHLPYDPPEEERQRFASGVERRDLGSTEIVGALLARHFPDEAQYADDLIDLYDAEINNNDTSFGRLLDEIDDLGLSDSTIVVFLADHGEEFYDHGGWIHGTSLYSEVLRIPLIIRVPVSSNVGRTCIPVQQADLMPTILSLLGLSMPMGLQGRNLLSPPSLRAPLSAYLDLDGAYGRSVVENGLHAIQHGEHGYQGLPEIYRIEDDPTEENDLARTSGARPAMMLSDDQILMQSEIGRFRPSETEVDEETRSRLEALGYL